MSDTVLVTGGCGFIGSHLVDALVERGDRVRVLDSLDPQVHPDGKPDYLNEAADYTFADVADPDALSRALDGTDVVYHFAAAVGVGQSMYEIERYVAVNTLATARLMETLVNTDGLRPRKLVVASSMSVYGEGAYACPEHGPGARAERPTPREGTGPWDPTCAVCGSELKAIPTPETKPVEPSSVYALTKYDQERLVLDVGRAYDLPVTALRFFNVYGPRQALSNPYTGVAAIFSSRIKAGKPPVIFEDGHQRRDFVSVRDIVAAAQLVAADPRADGRVFNVGSGSSVSILELARQLLEIYGRAGELEPQVTGRFRTGDIRHCFADIDALSALGYAPDVTLRAGLEDLATWAEAQEAEDRFDAADRQLRDRGLA